MQFAAVSPLEALKSVAPVPLRKTWSISKKAVAPVKASSIPVSKPVSQSASVSATGSAAKKSYGLSAGYSAQKNNGATRGEWGILC